jgi:hypothetical protein
MSKDSRNYFGKLFVSKSRKGCLNAKKKLVEAGILEQNASSFKVSDEYKDSFEIVDISEQDGERLINNLNTVCNLDIKSIPEAVVFKGVSGFPSYDVVRGVMFDPQTSNGINNILEHLRR